MKRYLWIAGCAAMAATVLALFVSAGQSHVKKEPLLYEISSGNEIALGALANRLTEKRVVLVGERHSVPSHHLMQLQVIKTLHRAGARVAVGMEMFRKDSQKSLDRWVKGEMDEEAFQKVYYDNWNYDWSLYEPILAYARQHEMPVLGLNVPRRITGQVARFGFESLNEEQRGELEGITCEVDQAYMDFIRRAYGAHAHGSMDFENFCEAQLVWDSAMAVRAVDFLKAHPDYLIVIITGVGHAWKGGIPKQLEDLSVSSYSVILPEIAGDVEQGGLDRKDADYIFLE